MKLRIMSDLHIDVNSNYELQLEDKDTFTLIAGDISGLPQLTSKWVKENIHNGAFVAGNHIVYNLSQKTLTELKQELADEFTLDSDVSFLDVETGFKKYLTENLVVLGTTLYTDYKFGNTEENNMDIGERYLNDFRYGKVKDNGVIRELHAFDYKTMFEKSFEAIKREVEMNPDKEFIILTHHCPSSKCIASKYVHSGANASYVSELDSFIESHSNIKLWVCGHVHNRGSFKIGNCLVIQNPRGYVRNYEDVDWTPNFFVDTETWETSSEEYFNQEWNSKRMIDDEFFRTLINKFY